MLMNFWLIMISWILFLNHFELLGIICGIVLAIYNYYFYKRINIWRIISIYLVLIVLAYLLVGKSNITSIYYLTYPFLIIMMYNYAYFNEILLKIKIKKMTYAYLILSFTTLFSTCLALIIPETNLLPDFKINVLTMIFLVFYPIFMEMTATILIKYRKLFLNKKLYNKAIQ